MARLIGLLILAFLAFLVFRTISGMSRLVRKTREADRRLKERRGGDMAEDPVCHTYIPISGAVQKSISGRVYYFCSQKCAEAYSGN
jgi:YHS domain-containing protein